MKAIRIVPGFSAEPFDVENTLKAKQETVGGYIQVVYPFDDPVGIVCNEEGKLMGLKPNRALYDGDGDIYDILCGNVLLLGLCEGDFCDLTPELEKKYLEQYKHPEQFYRDITGKIRTKKLPVRPRRDGEIWQLKEEDNHDLLFESYQWLLDEGHRVDKSRYQCVYRFDTHGDPNGHPEDMEEILEEIFVRFNIDRPEDFKGHSLSVSDVVVID